jgi:hypothetical protein
VSTIVVPQPVKLATTAVWAVLGLLVLRAILTFVFADQLLDAWIGDNATARAMPRELAEEGAPKYAAVAIGVLVIGAVLALAAVNLSKGARWARVVAIVFAALTVIGVVVSLIAPSIAVLVVLNIVVGVLALATIWLLVSQEASAFFAR